MNVEGMQELSKPSELNFAKTATVKDLGKRVPPLIAVLLHPLVDVPLRLQAPQIVVAKERRKGITRKRDITGSTRSVAVLPLLVAAALHLLLIFAVAVLHLLPQVAVLPHLRVAAVPLHPLKNVRRSVPNFQTVKMSITISREVILVLPIALPRKWLFFVEMSVMDKLFAKRVSSNVQSCLVGIFTLTNTKLINNKFINRKHMIDKFQLYVRTIVRFFQISNSFVKFLV